MRVGGAVTWWAEESWAGWVDTFEGEVGKWQWRKA